MDTELKFNNVRLAGAFLARECSVDPYNAVDCIYKALRTTGKTHGYRVSRMEDKKIKMLKIKD